MIGSEFTCNICGNPSLFQPQGDWREFPSCTSCGSSVRARHIAHCVTSMILGKSYCLPTVYEKSTVGIGLSDSLVLAESLVKAFSYTNTFYHMPPQLDICKPAEQWLEAADFLISSDVFEHVPNPVQHAFDGAYKVLKKNGVLILTVPFDERSHTTEHYPAVEEFTITDLNDEWLLVGKTSDGALEVHRNLVFHGGPGTTVEMRFFALPGLLTALEEAGFRDIKVHDQDVPHCGIFLPHLHGLPITATKGAKRS